MSRQIQPILAIAIGHTLPFKDIYHEKATGTQTAAITSLTPADEVREINTVWASTTATNSPVGTLMRQDKTGAIERYFHRGTGPYIQWSGKLLLPKDNRIRVLWDTIGNVELHVIGAKRYTRKELETLIHEVQLKFPVEVAKDIQQPGILKDPRM